MTSNTKEVVRAAPKLNILKIKKNFQEKRIFPMIFQNFQKISVRLQSIFLYLSFDLDSCQVEFTCSKSKIKTPK